MEMKKHNWNGAEVFEYNYVKAGLKNIEGEDVLDYRNEGLIGEDFFKVYFDFEPVNKWPLLVDLVNKEHVKATIKEDYFKSKIVEVIKQEGYFITPVHELGYIDYIKIERKE